MRLRRSRGRSPVRPLYSLEKEATLTTDDSQEAIGACLTQESHPVIYISQQLTSAEKNYSNIEREALAIVWSVAKLKHFLLGRSFDICTDHKPLVYLFGKTSAIPTNASARISRWELQLMGYEYNIRYVKGADIPHVDALSRLKFKEKLEDSKQITQDESLR